MNVARLSALLTVRQYPPGDIPGTSVRGGPGVAYCLRPTVSGSIPGGVTLGIFSVSTDGTMCPGVDSASKNEYQGFPLGVKAAGV
jgi:hypothetical protein